jgi:hypothetical protein
MSTIEIKREHGELDIINFSFRYIQLTEVQKNEIEKELYEKNTVIESISSNTNENVVIIDLDKSINPETIRTINKRLDIDETKFGIWVSLTSCYDHSGIRFPDYVIEFIRIVGGQVDVSIITISEDE